jgi:hypothetical protein
MYALRHRSVTPGVGLGPVQTDSADLHAFIHFALSCASAGVEAKIAATISPAHTAISDSRISMSSVAFRSDTGTKAIPCLTL